jgi:hypothetical protein
VAATWSHVGGVSASWPWFAAALLPNGLALALLLAQRGASAEQLLRLQRRALICLVIAVLVTGAGVAFAVREVYRATHGDSVEPSQRASVLAQGISEAMNFIALGVVTTPLPFLAYMVVLLRRRRLEGR